MPISVIIATNARGRQPKVGESHRQDGAARVHIERPVRCIECDSYTSAKSLRRPQRRCKVQSSLLPQRRRTYSSSVTTLLTGRAIASPVECGRRYLRSFRRWYTIHGHVQAGQLATSSSSGNACTIEILAAVHAVHRLSLIHISEPTRPY